MSLMAATAESLSQETGLEISDVHILIAKNSIAGLDETAIAGLLSVESSEVHEIQESDEYKAARLLLASEYSKTQLEKDFTWDDIEATAVRNLAKRVHLERDTETLLRIAAVANKAQRRTAVQNKQVLDPARGGHRVALSLTQRITERLQNGTTRTQERSISVLDGSAENPKFEDIDGLLGVTASQMPSPHMAIVTKDADFDMDDLTYGG